MTIKSSRKKLISYVADADDKKEKNLYLLVKDDMVDAGAFRLATDRVKIPEEERGKHVKGKSKSYSWNETKDLIRSKRKP